MHCPPTNSIFGEAVYAARCGDIAGVNAALSAMALREGRQREIIDVRARADRDMGVTPKLPQITGSMLDMVRGEQAAVEAKKASRAQPRRRRAA